MKAVWAVLLAVPLAACAQDVREVRLADVDLSDMDVVQEIREDLPAEDRATFGTYVVQHVATSSSFCGEVLVDENGKEPGTIGEAIALTELRAEKLRRERLAAERPPTAVELLRRKEESLIGAREALIARQSYLQMMHGAAARQQPEWEAIGEKMAEYDAQLQALKSAGG